MAEEKKPKKAINDSLAKAIEKSKVVERPIEEVTNRMNFAQANFSKKDLTARVEKNNPESPFQYQFKASILDGADLSYSNLEGQNFQGASMKGVNLSGANCKGCDFRWALMHGVIFDEDTIFEDANFWEAHGLPSV